MAQVIDRDNCESILYFLSGEKKEHLIFLFKYTPLGELPWECNSSGFQLSLKGGSLGYDIERFTSYAACVFRLKNCKGFDHFIKSFKNASQVDDTFFEAYVADLCFRQLCTVDLEFNNRFFIGNSWKNPDFVWKTIYGDFICECKDLNFFSHVEKEKFDKRANKIMEVLSSNFSTSRSRYRCEVLLKPGITSNSTKELAYEALNLAIKAKEKPNMPLDHVWMKLICIDRKFEIFFKDYNFSKATIRVNSGVPVNIQSIENHDVRVSAISKKIETKSLKLISDALKQIPDKEGVGIVFLGSSNEKSANNAAQKKIKQNISKLKIIVTITDSVKAHYKLEDANFVKNLFREN